MNQAISNALLFNIVIVFVIVLIGFFVGSLSYSKASKVKNRIIEEIEKYGEAANDQDDVDSAYTHAACGLLTWLDSGDTGDGRGIGYRKVSSGSKAACPNLEIKEDNNTMVDIVSSTSDNCKYTSNPYEYCVYRIKRCENENGNKKSCYTYYRVRTYMYFDVPIIEDLVKIPVDGETRGFRIKNS